MSLSEVLFQLSKNKTPLKLLGGITALLAGAYCGYLKANLQATYNNEYYDEKHLK